MAGPSLVTAYVVVRLVGAFMQGDAAPESILPAMPVTALATLGGMVGGGVIGWFASGRHPDPGRE